MVEDGQSDGITIRFSGGLNDTTLLEIAKRLKLNPIFSKVEAHCSTISRMGGGWSGSIWVMFVAGGGYVAKKAVDLIFEIFKNSLITEKDEPPFTIELYGPDDKLLASWKSEPKCPPTIITHSVVPPGRRYSRLWRRLRERLRLRWGKMR